LCQSVSDLRVRRTTSREVNLDSSLANCVALRIFIVEQNTAYWWFDLVVLEEIVCLLGLNRHVITHLRVLLLRYHPIIRLPLLLLVLLSTVVIRVVWSIVVLCNRYLDLLLVATLAVVHLGILVAVILVWSSVVGLLLLLHRLLFTKFSLSVGKTTLAFIRTLVLQEVLA